MAVFIALMLVGPSKCLKLNLTGLKIPTGRRQTSWLFTSMAEDCNSDYCDLSCDNVPNASRSNAERNGKQTGDERLGKPFETGTVNG